MHCENRAVLNVVAGELLEAIVTCNLAILTTTREPAQGKAYLQMTSTGPMSVVGDGPNKGFASNVGVWQPVTSIGLFRATGTGEVSVSAVYFSGAATLLANAGLCSVSLTRVNSGRGDQAATSEEDVTDASKIVPVRTDKLTKFAVTLKDTKVGEKILVRLTYERKKKSTKK